MMAQKKYFSLLTQKGMDKFAAASLDDTSVGFAYMSIGDGNGVVPVPDINQTGLVNETYRSRLNSVKIAESDENIIIAEMIIPRRTADIRYVKPRFLMKRECVWPWPPAGDVQAEAG
jgi:phage-related tail fiber protein